MKKEKHEESPTSETTRVTNVPTLKCTVDEVIEQHVGSLGLSQIIQVILVSLAWIFDAHGSLITIFSDAEPSWRCNGNRDGTFDSICQGKQIHKGGGICRLKPSTWEWVNGPNSSTIAEWSLVCDHKFLAAIPASCFFIGSLLGDPNTSDKNLWQCKWAMKRMAKTMAAGFGVGFMYYGIQLNVENMNLSTYLSVGMNGLMEIPAVVVGGLLIGTTNRRLLFSISSYIAGISCFLCIFFVNTRGRNWGSWIQLVTEGVGFMAASMAFDVLYIYCVELFPTNVRNFAVSLLRQALMLGGAVVPLFVAVGRLRPAISFMVFGGLAIASGLVSLWLPETKNAPLYETLEEQEKAEMLGACKGATANEIELELGKSDTV